MPVDATGEVVNAHVIFSIDLHPPKVRVHGLEALDDAEIMQLFAMMLDWLAESARPMTGLTLQNVERL